MTFSDQEMNLVVSGVFFFYEFTNFGNEVVLFRCDFGSFEMLPEGYQVYV